VSRLFQRTIRERVSCSGVALHAGSVVNLALLPAPANHGITFARTDIAGRPEVPARVENVVDDTLATTLGRGAATVATVEHLLAALAGLGVDNCRVELDGPEVPAMDGSSAPFVRMLESAGIREQPAMKRFLVVRDDVTVSENGREVRISPANGFAVRYRIDFKHPLISDQELELNFSERSFVREIAPARTFGFLKDVERMQAMGLGRGGSLENAIVIDEFNILNPGGLRYPDEFVRHKILDAVGDLALLGMPVMGRLHAVKSGHAMHHRLAQELLANGAAEVVEVREKRDLDAMSLYAPEHFFAASAA
jgi:UDP-3-O-[3-hydroxymyristoyl] N-acetylglucosamine deacetylase